MCTYCYHCIANVTHMHTQLTYQLFNHTLVVHLVHTHCKVHFALALKI